MKLKTILVDDEQHCLDTLSYDLEMCCGDRIEIVGTAQNAIQATALITSKKPELIFLDIELPGMTGLDFLESIGHLDADVVFTTAHSKYALEGYKFEVKGYLLKPIDPLELEQVVNRIYTSKQSDSTPSILDEKLPISDTSGTEFINFDHIVLCQSNNNYTILHLVNGQQKLVSKTLKRIESQLPKNQFIRIHQSSIINLQYVSKYLKNDGGQVELKNGQTIGISKSYKDSFLKLFQG